MKELLLVKNLSVSYKAGECKKEAVLDVSFNIKEGEIFSILGESGCGKTTIAHAIVGICEGEVLGEIIFKGKDLLKLSEEELRKIRGKEISLIMQEAQSALNPVLKIGTQIEEVIFSHTKVPKRVRVERSLKLLKEMGFKNPEFVFHSYPHQLSGGMRQRAMIAESIVLSPSLIIADEPTTALDVTLQLQIMKLLLKLRESGKSIIFITHDLNLASLISDRVCIMYKGEIVEMGPKEDVIGKPLHPYTEFLINSSLPKRVKEGRKSFFVYEENGEDGMCKFYKRCIYKRRICRDKAPFLRKVGTKEVRCHLI